MAAPEAPAVLTFSPPISRRRREALRDEALSSGSDALETDRVTVMNRSLSSLGLRPIVPSSPDSLLDALQSLLVTQSTFSAHQQESAHLERIGRLEAEKDVLQQRGKQLAVALDVAEREFAQKEEKLRAALSKASQQQRALEAEKAELAKEIAVLQHRDNQYLHEVRKKERELEKTQKKLQTALSERGVKDTRGIELHGAPRSTSATTKGGLSEADLQRRTIRSLEERVAALVAENDGLRTALQELSDRAASQTPAAPASEPDAPAADLAVPQIALLPLDGAESMQHLRSQIWRRIDQLKSSLSALEAQEGEVELASLQQQVNELRRIIIEQEHLLHFSLGSDAAPSPASREAEVWPSPVLRTATGNTPARSPNKLTPVTRSRRVEQQENRVQGLRV